MATVSLNQATIRANSKVQKIYPEKPKAGGELHETVALKLSREQAIELATNILIGASNWDELHITAFRKGNFITITSQQ